MDQNTKPCLSNAQHVFFVVSKYKSRRCVSRAQLFYNVWLDHAGQTWSFRYGRLAYMVLWPSVPWGGWQSQTLRSPGNVFERKKQMCMSGGGYVCCAGTRAYMNTSWCVNLNEPYVETLYFFKWNFETTAKTIIVVKMFTIFKMPKTYWTKKFKLCNQMSDVWAR